MPLNLVIGNKNYSSWSLRAWLAIELTGAAYDETLIPLFQPDSRQRLLTHSPTGKVPVLLTEADGAIWDSLSIGEYLAERFPEAGLWPRDVAARALARSVCAEMHSGFMALRSHMPMDMARRQALDTVPAEVEADIQRVVALWAECPLRPGRALPVRPAEPGGRLFRTGGEPVAQLCGGAAGRGRRLCRNPLPVACLPALVPGGPGGSGEQ